ncbi:response regulator [Paraburkholderia strydomiana]|uniref:response regulator n=1 Tax=Paraburkholderia strydomiana TaxID=1245417 RepID=UPI0038B889F8
MMKVLIVEDDEPKLVQVLEFLESAYSDLLQITVSKSLNSACRRIDADTFDVILLDMSIPTFDGGKTANASGRQRTYGGKDFLMYMWEMEYEAPIIVITQFKDFPGEDGTVDLPQLHAQMRRDFPSLYVGHVYFEHNSDAWKRSLERLLKEC